MPIGCQQGISVDLLDPPAVTQTKDHAQDLCCTQVIMDQAEEIRACLLAASRVYQLVRLIPLPPQLILFRIPTPPP